MLTELRVTNFKGFAGEHQVPLAPVTLLFGANSSGKTALLHAIALMAENFGSSLLRRPTGSFDLSVPEVDLGGYRNLIHRHDTSGGSYIGLGVTLDVTGFRPTRGDFLDALGAEGASHDFRLVQGEDGRVYPETSSVVLHGPRDIPLDFSQGDDRRRLQLASLSDERARIAAVAIHEFFERITGATPEPSAEELDLDDEDLVLVDLSALEELSLGQLEQVSVAALERALLSGTGLRPAPGSVGHFGGWGPRRVDGSANVPREIAALLERIVIPANRILRQGLARMDYLGPMREVPSRLEELGNDQRERITSSGSGIASSLSGDRQALQQVNRLLSDLDIPYIVDVKSVGQHFLPSAGDYRALVLTDQRTQTEVSPRDLGFGITQLLPILVALARRSPNLLLVEQPELHLHPRLHADLASLFVDASRQQQPTQVVAETHSENLVLRVQKLVRDRVISPDEVSIVYVGASEGAGSWIQPIRMDEQGQLIDQWPGGFFTERAQEWL